VDSASVHPEVAVIRPLSVDASEHAACVDAGATNRHAHDVTLLRPLLVLGA